MKQLNSLYNSNAEELLGRVTLSGKNIFNRSAYILVTNEQNTPKGYKAIISAHDFSDKISTPCIKVDNISGFNEGDVINISPNGGVFYMKSILHPMQSLLLLVAIIAVSCVLNLQCSKRRTELILI